MASCINCIHKKVCEAFITKGWPYADDKFPADRFCLHYKSETTANYETTTNYENIKSMSITEMAEWLYFNLEYLSSEYGACSGATDPSYLLKWLESGDVE